MSFNKTIVLAKEIVEQNQLIKLIKKYQNGSATVAEEFVIHVWYDSLDEFKSRFDIKDSLSHREKLQKQIISIALTQYRTRFFPWHRYYTCIRESLIARFFFTKLIYRFAKIWN